jgi:hypothetical protein
MDSFQTFGPIHWIVGRRSDTQGPAKGFRKPPADEGGSKAGIRAEIKCQVVDIGRTAKYISTAFRPEGGMEKI